ncbi:hypothetical protein DFP72DRAFT_1167026 [Ephemerocybe angulata]|uniref:Mucoidy inhibitor A n=1 Tax=Ephemerocybe angulata TaxID=980116 RepID=A0A8H6HK48_9AGAR|nr:hypothetical protein DFP72DRAFT_918098 [Tulosesus angulatus]KAF6759121.1 hypothetical protein DFP72DRAFT_1167026 [Tulosesus angulatus]
MSSDIQPPAFETSNSVELSAQKDSKILSVSVYAGRAEITRLFKFDVKTGQNQVVVTDLPFAIDQQSFRVEGRGAATIHDVTISTVVPPEAPTTSEKLEALQAEQTKTLKALARAEKALSSLETYLNSLNSQHLDVSKLPSIVDSYDAAAEKLDTKVTELENTKIRIEKEIEEETKSLAGPKGNEKLNLKSTIGVFADLEGEVEIALIYAVRGATWSAQYDIRVAMQSKEKPVNLIYKGALIQDTGEDWTDVPITLETAAPTFGVEIPQLDLWTISVARPVFMKKSRSGFGGGGPIRPMAMSYAPGSPSYSPSSPTLGAAEMRVSAYMFADEGGADAIQHRGLDVSSRGNITATFSVPGLMTIPSDGVSHKVTIVKLALDATMEWVSVPKRDPKVHLKAVIKNASQYTLLSGPASVYVDGSFISRSDVPAVSPEESFDCPLGLDPSIRVTYLPLSKKVSQSGFMTKATNYIFTQRITLHNTKSLAIENVKLIDQIPVSENSVINVKLISPALDLTDSGVGTVSSTLKAGWSENKAGVKIPPPAKVGQGILAQWDGADEVNSEDGVESLGKDGKISWICALPSQGKVTLTLQWEVSAPLRTDITGL